MALKRLKEGRRGPVKAQFPSAPSFSLDLCNKPRNLHVYASVGTRGKAHTSGNGSRIALMHWTWRGPYV